MRRAKARVRSIWRALRRSNQLDAAMHNEIRFHIDMEAERLMCDQALDVHEARRRAYVAFGGVEKYKEEARDARPARRSLRTPASEALRADAWSHLEVIGFAR